MAIIPSPQNRAGESLRNQLKKLPDSSRTLMAHHLTGTPGLHLPEWLSNFSSG
jgi:hypothetical protein